jgi:beta-glucosidase
MRALDGATVLLENRDRLLPLKNPTRICVLGDYARENGDVLPLIEAIGRHGHTYVGYARGYDPATSRNDALTVEAVALAAESDVILAFVGTEAGKRRLPAAQLALLDELGRVTAEGIGKREKHLVVILSSEISPDMDFVRTAAKPISGLLLTPLSVKGAPLHAVETLLGDRSPLGRLTETLTDPTHPAANRRGYKIGPFVGYRYYDTVGCGAVYPFGHGLSYTKFRYTFVKIGLNGSVTFTVKHLEPVASRWMPVISTL